MTSRYNARPTFKKKELTEKNSTCLHSKTNGICPYWFVKVTEDECYACFKTGGEAKIKIMERSMQEGVVRHRDIKSCVHRGNTIITKKKTCCGGSKEVELESFYCNKHKLEKQNEQCYSCPHFKIEER